MDFNTLRNIDYAVFHFINRDMANPVLDLICPVLRNAYTWIPLYAALGIYLLYKYKKKAWIYALYLLAAFAISDSVNYHIFKPFFARVRPCHNMIIQARLLLGNCGGKWGFPSSHASNHITIALSIVLARIFNSRWLNSAWILWALLISFSQVYVGAHYPFDILGGFIFGTIVALLNYYALFPLLIRWNNKLRK